MFWQNNLTYNIPGGSAPDPKGGFSARMKLGAPLPDTRLLRHKNYETVVSAPDPRWGSAPDPDGFAARM